MQLARLLVVLGMDQRAGEDARVFGHALVPVMPVADDDALVVARLAVIEADLPALVGERHGAHHLLAELDAVEDAAVAREALEVRAHLLDAGEVGIVVGHRIVGVGGRLLGRHDVHAFVEAVAPVAADAVVGVHLVEGDPAPAQRIGHGEPDGSGSDDE